MTPRRESHPEEISRLMEAAPARALRARASGWSIPALAPEGRPRPAIHAGPAAWMCHVGAGHLCEALPAEPTCRCGHTAALHPQPGPTLFGDMLPAACTECRCDALGAER